MAKKDMDLRKLFVPVRLHNTRRNGDKGDSSFDTTDIAYFHSVDEIKDVPEEKRKKSLSDFALSNYAWQSSGRFAEDGKTTGAFWLRSANGSLYVQYIYDNGSLDWTGVEDENNGSSVALDLDLKSFISARSASRHVDLTTKKDKNGKKKHFVELGEYVGDVASSETQQMLENAFNGGNLRQGLSCTGRLFTTNGQREYGEDFLSKQNPEFEYNGQKYVRVIVWHDAGNHYADGTTVAKTGSVVWHKVAPVSLEIQNWDKLPRSINPKGKRFGADSVIHTETQQCVLSGIPFYPNYNDQNCSMWQNSLARAFFNSAKSSELDGNPEYRARLQWDFSKSGFLYQAFDMTREPTREYTIPETEKEISDYAFAGCVGIRKVVVPEYVSKVGVCAFHGCVNSQIVFVNPQKIKFDNAAFEGTNFKYVYISKDQVVLSPYVDEKLEKTHFRTDFDKEEVSKIFNKNYRENFINVKEWKASGKIKFIPPEYTLQTFPSSEMEKYFLNNNNQRWGKLVKTLGFDTLEGTEKNNSLVDLMKIYYAIGGFSANQGESERAFDYILKNVAIVKMQNPTASQIGAEIHQRFSGLRLKGPYNPDFAKFFMRYYKDNPDFMNFRLRDEDGDLKDSQDYLCAAHNAFDRIQKIYPYRVVNGNEERALLSPRFVAEHCSIVEYEDVEEGNESLAELIGQYCYDQDDFEHIQEVYDYAKTIKDKYVIRADKAKGKNGISFRVLEKDDPLGFVLGNITNCCQRIGDAAEKCVDDGYQNPEAGFLVFEESELDENGNPTGEMRILGQAYIWYDPQTKTVCYDNIEIPSKVLDELRKGGRHDERLSSKHLMDAVIESADAIMSSMNRNGVQVERVTTGQGYNDLRNELEARFGEPEHNPRAQHRNYSGYSDAKSAQYLIRTYDETTKLYSDTIRELGADIQKDLDSIERSVHSTKEK